MPSVICDIISFFLMNVEISKTNYSCIPKDLNNSDQSFSKGLIYDNIKSHQKNWVSPSFRNESLRSLLRVNSAPK